MSHCRKWACRARQTHLELAGRVKTDVGVAARGNARGAGLTMLNCVL